MITRRLGPCRRPVDRYSHSMNLFNSLSIYLRFIYELLRVCSVEFCGASQTNPASRPVVKREMRNCITTFFPSPKPKVIMTPCRAHTHTYSTTTLFFFSFLLGIPKTIKLTYGSARQCDNRGLPSANLGKEDEKSGGRTDTRSKRKGVTVTEQAEFD